MCLGVPGAIVSDRIDGNGLRLGMVRFGGVEREVCLAFVPDASVGDYVIVHVGVAISRIGPEEAREVFGYLAELEAAAAAEARP